MPKTSDELGPKIVHKVKSKLGYTEMQTTAPGFAEDVSLLKIFWIIYKF